MIGIIRIAIRCIFITHSRVGNANAQGKSSDKIQNPSHSELNVSKIAIFRASVFMFFNVFGLFDFSVAKWVKLI